MCWFVTYNRVVAHVIRLPPSTHHISVVEGQNGDDIDAFLFQFWEGLDVAGQMGHGAGGCEGACSNHHRQDIITHCRVCRIQRLDSPGTENRTTFLSAHSWEAL